jgi:mannose-6-phosphate isomerase-like protein (cupin superfamily)
MEKVNLTEKFGLFQEHWSPKIVGRVQDCDVRLAKVLGAFEWHQHPDEDEMFFVVKGHLLMRFRDRDVSLDEGEFLIVPRGVEHLPVADEEVWLMLVEPSGTLNTGNTVSDRTVTQLDEL